MLPHFNRRRRSMHDPGYAGRLALEVRIVFLKIISRALLLTFRCQLRFGALSADQNPYAIKVGMFAGEKHQSDQQALHRSLSSHPPLPFAIPSRNAAKPQSRSVVPSGNVAVRKYPRLASRLLGLTLTVTLSPT